MGKHTYLCSALLCSGRGRLFTKFQRRTADGMNFFYTFHSPYMNERTNERVNYHLILFQFSIFLAPSFESLKITFFFFFSSKWRKKRKIHKITIFSEFKFKISIVDDSSHFTCYFYFFKSLIKIFWSVYVVFHKVTVNLVCISHSHFILFALSFVFQFLVFFYWSHPVD